MQILDLTDKLARFPIAYNLQPVRGWPVKHFDTPTGQSFQRTKQHGLAEGPWDACERLYTDGFPIDPADFVFHPGLGDDAPDIHFPSDAAHPWTSYISAKCRTGLSDDQLDKLFGIYRTLRTGNYNGAGQQLNSAGAIVTPADPRTEFFFKPNPANASVDQIVRWGKRPNDIINWPAWVDWRDYNDELIPIDDSVYTPRSLSLTPTVGGTLAGGTYYVRVSTMKGGDESSASLKTLEIQANSITLSGGQTAFQVNWLIKGDEQDPPTSLSGITSYRIYIGTVPGVWLGYFSVGNPAARNFLVTTTAGATAGVPQNLATSGLLVNVKRFECGLFFIPPYDLGQALDQICQISCADWQWSGLGTNTFRNDKVRFMSPANRAPVFTLNLAETGFGSLKTYPVDRRNRPNQVVVNFRDQDDEFLGPAQPVVLDREQLQEDDGQIKTQTIEGGTMRRNQAQRVASFFARVLCDMDQMSTLMASPKTYFLLPGDVINVTNPMPDWTDIKFVVRKKNEKVETGLGDDILAQIYTNDLYSDTDYKPLPIPLPAPRLDPFAAPPAVSNLVLTEANVLSPDFSFNTGFKGIFDFTLFHGQQIARILVKGPSPAESPDSAYNSFQVIPPDSNNKGFFEFRGLAGGHYWVKVITESALGDSLPAGHPVQNIQLSVPLPTDLRIIDGVPPRDNFYDALGLTLAVGPSDGAGIWLGCRIYKDRGFGYEWVGDITKPSSIGTSVAPFLTLAGDQVDIQIGAYVPVPTNATLAEVNVGKNNWMVGREVVGVRTWTNLGGGVYRGTNLVRGLRLTDHLQETHTGAEDVIMLDESISFVPMESRDLDMNINFKAVTYGLLIGAVAVKTVFFTGNSVVTHPPKAFAGFFDKGNGNCLLDWIPGEDRIGVESYELELRNGPGSGAATIRGPLTITPVELARTSQTPPLERFAVGSALPAARYTFSDPGTVRMLFESGEHSSTNGCVRSSATIDLSSGFIIEVGISEFWIFPDYFAIEPDDGSFNPVFLWKNHWSSANPMDPNHLEPESSGIFYATTPGDRIGIVGQPDGTVIYTVNYLGASSQPIFVSKTKIDYSKTYRMVLREPFTQFPFDTPTRDFGFKEARWLRNTPESVYTGEMQKSDLGVSILPATVYARVRQKSFLPKGKPSDWTYGAFVRP